MSEIVHRKVERIHAFDILRGYFLIVILFNHLAYYPSGLDILTGRGELYASTAEGFFLISGIILGIVRGRKLIDASFRVGARLLLKRAFQLYITSVVLIVLFTLIGWMFLGFSGLKEGILDPSQGIVSLLYQAATFQYLYGWADFLRHYAIFIAVAPLALWLLRKGLWYIVIAVSFGIWLLFPSAPVDGIIVQPISWQLIFFSGFVIGFHWPDIQVWWRRLSMKIRTTIGLTLVASFVITLTASFILVFGSEHSPAVASIHHVVEQYFNKDRLPIPRLLLGAVWFWALFWLVRRYESVIRKKTSWLIELFGVNSLYVYTIQAFLVFFMHLFVMQPLASDNIAVNLAMSLLVLAVVYFATKKKFLMNIIPR